jgi:phosphocarrier protein
MFVKEITIQNQVGLHARPATFFIQKANEYKSSIWVEKEERRVNAKSLLGILSLGIVGGTTIKIVADGSDEQEAIEGLVKLIESGFIGVALFLLYFRIQGVANRIAVALFAIRSMAGKELGQWKKSGNWKKSLCGCAPRCPAPV